MFCALLKSRYQVSVYRTNGPLVFFTFDLFIGWPTALAHGLGQVMNIMTPTVSPVRSQEG